ncbi:MAG: alanine--glyoxylate aminotransferase family protein [Proteobacteria bacterium]|jgi:alanine-glyoxylate transaminase / serine-glyoxylate transaminase / serine-pyruvate transaminase|nr:alanine--glyoxylate aminotransferase family protein [Pseudomonadota bacterium]
MEQITSFNPPHRILMGPGPSDVPQRILDASARPTIGHLDPEFIHLMDEIKQLLGFAFRTENRLTMPISAPGSAGMEACFVNLVEPGDKVLVCINGVFGNRMVENVNRCGGVAITVDDEWGKPVDPQKVEDALKADPEIKVLAFVHAETSTGVRSDAAALASLGKEHGCLVIADTVTALGGIDVRIDDWRIDASYAGTQKCLSCLPGVSPVTFSDEAAAKLSNRKQPVQSWFLDMNLVMAYWDDTTAQRSYHHTAPINALYALHESLIMLQEEGLEAAFARHKAMHDKLKEGLGGLGMEFLVEPEYQLPQLNLVCIPDGVDDAAVRNQLLEEYDLEIGAGLGGLAGKVWRIGLMGNSATEKNVNACVSALANIIE